MRRSFAAALAAGLALPLAAGVEIPEDRYQNGFAVGVQAWTFKEYSVFEAIEKTKQAGGKVIELFPGQRLGGEFGNAKFDHHSPTAHRDAVKAKLKAEDILAVNYGVVGIPDNEAQARAVFDFAKDMGLYAVTTESAESINLIEKLVKEYDIRVGFHEHAVQPGNYKYRVWHPLYVMGLVSGRDPRIGACADTGHWQRSGLRPVECLKMLEGRIVSVHLKDLNEFGKHGALDVPYGTGKGDIPGVLAELKRQGVKGNVMVEYEDKWKTNVAEATQCIAFVKSWQP